MTDPRPEPSSPALAPEIDQRLVRLEQCVAHLERQNEELNGVLADQSRTLSKLQTVIRRLSETVENAELDRIRATNPRPPHSA